MPKTNQNGLFLSFSGGIDFENLLTYKKSLTSLYYFVLKCFGPWVYPMGSIVIALVSLSVHGPSAVSF